MTKIKGPRTRGRFKGVSVSKDENGFYVHTHRVRGKSKPSLDKISDSEIKRIRATG